MELTTIDRKGLIREAYRIDGITKGECRTIFLDWALSAPGEVSAKAAIEALVAHYGADADAHPMTQVLREGLATAPEARRRGGRAGRLGSGNGPKT